ncbi:DUF2079 domain-containing protein [Ilumatobacter sp.]|uniref:DUF2079 domain-containing protein n=1 Tax=Ilumatobacter sp. TaxID=1967498 RepID=UPI003753DA3D
MTDQLPVDEQAVLPIDASDQVGPGAADRPVDAAKAHRRSLNEWLSDRTVPQALMVLAVVLYTAYFTQRSLDIHHGLGTASYDSALYDQGMWLLSRGQAPFVTLMGRNMFGDHTSFILLFLVPLYWIAPGAGIMFFAQSAAIGAGAIPIFLYGRRRLGSEWMAFVGGLVYLVHPAVGWTNLENFHPDAFLGVLVGCAIYGALERKWRVYGVFVVLSLMVKEDVSLVIVPLGIWVALRRDRRIGLITILGSIGFMFTAMYVVMRGLIGVPTRNAWRLPFSQDGDSTFRGAARLVETAVTNPTELADHLRAENRPWYIWQMTTPFALLFLRLPSVALISGLVLFTNILSTFWYQFQVEYHYSLIAVPALAMGTIHAIGTIRDQRDLLAMHDADADADERPAKQLFVPTRLMAMGVLAVTAALTSMMWAPVPWSRTQLYYGNPDNVYATTMREIISDIPDDAAVAAHYRVTPHLAYRTDIYQFPNPFRVDLYGADAAIAGTRLADRADRIEFVVLPTSEDENLADDWALVSSAFDEVDRNDIWILYERDRSVALPGNPVIPG